MSSKLLGHVWDLELPDHATKLVLLRLADSANDETGECWPSLKYIQDKCNVKSKNTIRRALEILEQMGLVVVIKRKLSASQNTSNLYKLNIERILNNGKRLGGSNSELGGSNSELGGSNSELGGSNSELGGSNSELGGGSNSEPRTNNSLEPINESTSSSEKNFQTEQRAKKYSFSPDDMRAAEWIFELLRKLNPEFKVKSMDSWANCVRLMRERDGRTHRDICELFQWANQDSFWSLNILSPSSLREKWVQLSIKKQASDRKPRRTTFQERNSTNWGTAKKMAEVF
nr:MAG TPA: replication protein O [Caudoviricetes sp.]